jgi:hypothetical protein
MARLDLSTRATRLANSLAGRSIDALPKYLQRDLERFTRAIGIDVETFTRYAPSTRQRYIRAAKQGRTAAQERERVRAQRAARPKKTKTEKTGGIKTRRQHIKDLQKWMIAHGMDATRGEFTKMDDLRSENLLSDDAIDAHIRVYGEEYVYVHLLQMKNAMIDKRFATAQWQAFKASDYYVDDVDERWWWYHSSAILDYSGIGFGSLAS